MVDEYMKVCVSLRCNEAFAFVYVGVVCLFVDMSTLFVVYI